MSNNTKSTLTLEDVIALARRSQLFLTQEEEDHILNQLDQTIEYMSNIAELDLEGVKETSHTSSSTNLSFEDGTPADRTLTQQEAVAGAKSEGGYVIVTRILEK